MRVLLNRSRALFLFIKLNLEKYIISFNIMDFECFRKSLYE